MEKTYTSSVGGDENLLTFAWFSVSTLSLSGLSTRNHSQSLSWLLTCFCSGNKFVPLVWSRLKRTQNKLTEIWQPASVK